MKLVKGQEFDVPNLGPMLTVPVVLVEEKTEEYYEYDPADHGYVNMFGGWGGMGNVFKTADVPKTPKTRTVETKTDILILVDRKHKIDMRCLDVGFTGNPHKFAVTKGKETFICLVSEDSLRKLVDET
jgi:GTPase involved in cell partitioning and DNA repair